MRFIRCSAAASVVAGYRQVALQPRPSPAESCFSLGRRPRGREGEEGKRAGSSLPQLLRMGMHQPQKNEGVEAGLGNSQPHPAGPGAAPPGRRFDGSRIVLKVKLPAGARSRQGLSYPSLAMGVRQPAWSGAGGQTPWHWVLLGTVGYASHAANWLLSLQDPSPARFPPTSSLR